jgi:hypothetical protein
MVGLGRVSSASGTRRALAHAQLPSPRGASLLQPALPRPAALSRLYRPAQSSSRDDIVDVRQPHNALAGAAASAAAAAAATGAQADEQPGTGGLSSLRVLLGGSVAVVAAAACIWLSTAGQPGAPLHSVLAQVGAAAATCLTGGRRDQQHWCWGANNCSPSCMRVPHTPRSGPPRALKSCPHTPHAHARR